MLVCAKTTFREKDQVKNREKHQAAPSLMGNSEKTTFQYIKMGKSKQIWEKWNLKKKKQQQIFKSPISEGARN